MGRFETAAEFYQFREPYPPELFEQVAKHLGLNSESRLLDVGCGPGNLAIGFAPCVGSCLAIDIEAEMLAAARKAAPEAASQLEFRQVSIEELHEPEDSFDLITIGRAIHWFSRDATLQVFERVLKPSGTIAVCSTGASNSPENDWTKQFRNVRQHWSKDYEESRYRPDLDEWFSPSRFRRKDEIEASQSYHFSLEELIKRGLSFSVTSPAVLGDRRPEFEADMRSVLLPFTENGQLTEELTGKAILFSRELA